MPDGNLIDSEGHPTNDPAVMFEHPKGALTTFGRHKGFGLALLCDILGGSFSGGGAYRPERAEQDQRASDAVPVDDGTWQQLKALARELGIAAETIPVRTA